MTSFLFAFVFHRELIDEPGFWIAALIFFVLVSIVVFIVLKWLVELIRYRNRR